MPGSALSHSSRPTSPSEVSSPSLWRQEFEIHPEAVYLDTAGEGPLPRRACAALLEVLEKKTYPLQVGGEEYFQIPSRTRRLCAQITGCRPEEIVLTGSTGGGVNLAINGLPLQRGDEILFLKGDFPALVNPILHARRKGLVPVEISPAARFPSLEDFERGMTPRTRLLALSHVMSATGFRHDLRALGSLCRQHGAFFLVDAAQSAGVIPLHLEEDGIDIVAAPAHKWLLGLPGVGFAAIRGEVMDRMEPPAVGWIGCLSNAAQFISMPPFDLGLFKGGKRFEVGTTPYPQLAAWNASLELILEIGVETIQMHVFDLLRPLRDFLQRSRYKLVSSPEEPHFSGILSFTGRFAAKLFVLLNERKIFPGLRAGSLRVSAHFYNTPEEIQRLIEALEELESVKLEADRKGENL
jgi:cysteine desulfurase/selenocysteine lyase